MVAVAEDGRNLRRSQNREAVLSALSSLFAEGLLEPSAEEIAERAGVSARSLFRYFDDLDDLHRAAIGRVLDAARPLLDMDVDPAGSTAQKAEAVAAARGRLFEEMAPAARAARACAHRNPLVAAQVKENKAFFRRQVRTVFGPELRERPELLPAVDALCSFEAYELLRHDQGLSRPKAVAALAAALRQLLAR